MAVKIERVEREFILNAAAEAKTEARLQSAGRTLRCRIVESGGSSLGLEPCESLSQGIPPRARVSVYFDFRGQGVAFTSPVLKAAARRIELGSPEGMYRSLSRKWPRVPAPQSFAVDFLLPEEEIELDCPESVEWVPVELPELHEGLDTKDLAALVDSFKERARSMACEGRVVMFKGRGPADYGEELAARLGKALFVPSTRGELPQSDPYQAGRIVTKAMVEEFEGPAALVEGSRMAGFLAERAADGLVSGLWCPVPYYRYSIGVVELLNDRSRPQPLDFTAVDLAWEFSRVLAYFLKRHAYFASKAGDKGRRKGGIVDASPTGLLVGLPTKGPRYTTGAVLPLSISVGDKSVRCAARVMRGFDDGATRFYGLAFQALHPDDMAAIARELYGAEAAIPESARGFG